MDATFLSTLVHIQSAPADNLSSTSLERLTPAVTAPAKTTPGRHTRNNSHQQDEHELQRIPTRDILPTGERSSFEDGNELEMSRPPTPDAVEVVPSVWEPYMNRYRMISICLMNLGGAMNDGAAGALIPYMEK